MTNEQLEMLKEIDTKHEEASRMLFDYWDLYSHIGTWQFWVIFICLFALPLIVLYFAIDRKKIFLIGFYGFSINVWFNFADNIGTKLGWWDYPYMFIPVTPTGFSINATVVPVVFMLVYQWTLNHNKNFYLYSLLAAMFLSFVFLPLLAALDFFKLNRDANYLHFLLIYTGVFLFSKLIINVFLYRERQRGDLLNS